MTESEYLRGLLDLVGVRSALPLLERALRLVLARVDASYGYIEVEAEPLDEHDRRVWCAHDCSAPHVAVIQARISRTLVASALMAGTVVHSSSATDDPRFANADSVRQFEIGAVFCAPFGRRLTGVIYVQRSTPGAFQDDSLAAAERAAHLLTELFEPAPLHVGPRPTARQQANIEIRERLAQAIADHGRNHSAIESVTGISRTQQRRLLGERVVDRRKR